MHRSNHVNAFIAMNGIPYLLGEYADHASLNTVDRSFIYDDIVVDQKEAMRPVIDISIDGIGKNASNGLPSIIGNTSRYKNLLAIIHNMKREIDGKFPVIKPGLVVRVYYQLENNKSKQVIRSIVEDLRINNREYFLDINPDDINNNAIITHFCDSMMSTVNAFTQGTESMILRITSIQLCYEVVCKDIMTPRLQGPNPGANCAAVYDNQYAGIRGTYVSNWNLTDRFYHFDNNGRDILVHPQEINDIRNKVLRIECGKIQVNRYFAINPASRLVFKFSIWQNDVILVNDTSEIANVIYGGYQFPPMQYPPFNPQPRPEDYPPPHHNHYPRPSQKPPMPPVKPPKHKGKEKIREIEKAIKELQKQLEELEFGDGSNFAPMDPDDINDAVQDALDNLNNDNGPEDYYEGDYIPEDHDEDYY